MSDYEHLNYVFKYICKVDYDNKHVHQCILAMRSCAKLRLPILLNANSDANVMCTLLFHNVSIDTICLYTTKEPSTLPNTLLKLFVAPTNALDYYNKNQQSIGFRCIPWQSTPFKSTLQYECPL
jgi:hypothetical protein